MSLRQHNHTTAAGCRHASLQACRSASAACSHEDGGWIRALLFSQAWQDNMKQRKKKAFNIIVTAALRHPSLHAVTGAASALPSWYLNAVLSINAKQT